MTTVNSNEHYLDVKGLNCPLPILKIKKALGGINSGEHLRVEATDIGAMTDIPAFTKQTGHVLITKEDQGEVLVFVIQKK